MNFDLNLIALIAGIFDLNLIALIAGIVVACLTGVSVCISIFTRLKANGKKRKAEKAAVEHMQENAEALAATANGQADEIKSLTRLNELIRNVIPSAVTIAEESGINSGVAKLTFALSKIALWCTEEGFDYNEHKQEITDEVEKLISLSKVVNARKG